MEEASEQQVTPIGGGALAPLAEDVARTLSSLANLIDATIAVRGVGTSVATFAAGFLGVAPIGVVATTRRLRGIEFQMAGLVLAEQLEATPPVALIGADQDGPPTWAQLHLGPSSPRIPVRLAAAFTAGDVAPCALVAAVVEVWDDDSPHFDLVAYTRSGDARHGDAFLDHLVERSRHRDNPFRNRVLAAGHDDTLGLELRVVEVPPLERRDLVLPARLWAEVDRSVHGLFANLDRLGRAGLATNRGVLLAGPPGTGKTTLCKVIATELAGSVTVVLAEASAMASSLRQLYAELTHLAPAVVILEDIDLAVGGRSPGMGPGPLIDFLLALDGAVSTHSGVVTIATTNAPRSLDPAARRSARLDVVIEVPPPDRDGRAAVLGRYLRDVDGGDRVDVDRLARATDGATGADLRALVSVAVLDADGCPVDTDVLLSVARRRQVAPVPGLYL